MDRISHVYIMAGPSGVLYIGVTSALHKRVADHKSKRVPGFTEKYNLTKLVWLAPHTSIRAAIAREKQIKTWSRKKKIALIESINPAWADLNIRPLATNDAAIDFMNLPE